MKIQAHEIARMIDPSTLKIDTTENDVLKLIEACKKYDFICAFAWPCFGEMLGKALKDTNTRLGASLSFPSGQEPTEIKVKQAEYFMKIGAEEIDMVMNVGYLKSGCFDKAKEDILAVKAAINGKLLKVIVESMLLTDEQLIDACKIVMDCGADFVKTGTGFSPNPTTLHHVEVMKKTIGNSIKLKVAGGVRDLNTLLNMHVRGAERFGIGLAASINIMEEALSFKDGVRLPELSAQCKECETAKSTGTQQSTY